MKHLLMGVYQVCSNKSPWVKILGINIDLIMFYTDECQTKYGNANAWRYCCKVFDLLTVAAVSMIV
jgi:hypothetical protein